VPFYAEINVNYSTPDVDFLFTCVVLIHVRLFRHLKLLFNGNYYKVRYSKVK